MKAEAETKTVKCKQCSTAIPRTATLCKHCNSYQDWRGKLSLSTTMVALLVALVSVATTSIPLLSAYFHEPNSELQITNPVANGRSIYLAATNTGDAAGVLLRAEIQSPYFNRDRNGTPDIALRTGSDAIVPPGTKQLTLDFNLKRDQIDTRLLMMDVLMSTLKPHSLTAARLNVVVAEHDGSQGQYSFALSNEQLVTLLEGHADRCQSLGTEASFRNGCGGLAELRQEANRMHEQLQKSLKDAK